MHWFLAAATGWNARRDALLGQHLTDFVPVLPLIPHHRGRRRQVFEHPISTSEVTALPLTPVESQGTTLLLSQTPWSLLVVPPLVQPIRRGDPPFVEAGRRGMGFDVSGVNHQHLWLWGIGSLCGVGCWQLGKDQIKHTLVSPAAATVVEGCVGASGGRGIIPDLS